MFVAQVLLGAFLVVAASARYIEVDIDDQGYGDKFSSRILMPVDQEFYHPQYVISRVRRGADKAPLAAGNDNVLSLTKSGTTGLGLALDNANGHGLSTSFDRLPQGDKLTGAGKVNLFHNDNHNLDASAFVSRKMPNQGPDFNTYGGALDYKNGDSKFGASAGMQSTPLFHQKDYSAGLNMNLYKTPTSSLDLGAGFHRMDNPYISTPWERNVGMSWSSSW